MKLVTKIVLLIIGLSLTHKIIADSLVNANNINTSKIQKDLEEIRKFTLTNPEYNKDYEELLNDLKSIQLRMDELNNLAKSTSNGGNPGP